SEHKTLSVSWSHYLHRDIGSHFGWLDTNEERRFKSVQNILNREASCLYLTDELFRARNPVP
ncbi:TPA: hypothetical protein ACNV5Q_001156, partial [Citrobacter braakii]